MRHPRLLVALVAAPIPALAVGVVVMHASGISATLWSQNAAAVLLGSLLCVSAAARGRSRGADAAVPRFVVVGIAALVATFVAPGIDGVHRWIGIGPLRLHVAATLLPAMLAALSDSEHGRRAAVYGPSVVSALLFAQPDAAQASAFAVAWAVAAGTRRHTREAAGPLVVLALATATWFRADSLAPVPYVEGILRLTQTQGPGLAAAGELSLFLLPLPFLLDPRQRAPGAAVAAYLLCTVLVPLVGNYPVPVMGYGVAPILGYYAGAAAFMLGSRHPAPA